MPLSRGDRLPAADFVFGGICMSLIKIENLTFAYPGSFDNVFENACVQLDTDWKLGFVGRNGRGKTTLFRLLLGDYEYRGRIVSSVAFDYFPYAVPDKTMLTLEALSAVCPGAEEWELLRETSLLDVEPEALYRPFDTLSNGEQTKAAGVEINQLMAGSMILALPMLIIYIFMGKYLISGQMSGAVTAS